MPTSNVFTTTEETSVLLPPPEQEHLPLVPCGDRDSELCPCWTDNRFVNVSVCAVFQRDQSPLITGAGVKQQREAGAEKAEEYNQSRTWSWCILMGHTAMMCQETRSWVHAGSWPPPGPLCPFPAVTSLA